MKRGEQRPKHRGVTDKSSDICSFHFDAEDPGSNPASDLKIYLFLKRFRIWGSSSSSIIDHQQQMQSQEIQEAEEETEGIWYQGRTTTEPKIGPLLNTSSLSLGNIIM